MEKQQLSLTFVMYMDVKRSFLVVILHDEIENIPDKVLELWQGMNSN